MAVQLRGDSYRILFRFHGKQHSFSIGKVSESEADAKSAQVDYLLLRLKQGLIEIPPGMGIVDFVQFDGKPVTRSVTKTLRLTDLCDRFLGARASAVEESTQKTSGIHFKHLVTSMGAEFPVVKLTHTDLQRHVDRRTGLGVTATTVRKEITTLRTAWHWAVDAGFLSGSYPNRGLVYPKEDELPPYQTFDEIRSQIDAGGLTIECIEEMWGSLFLRPQEVAELLDYI